MRVLRTLELPTSAVEERMWIADAYFLSMATLTRGLLAAARDGVDVCILVSTPATNDQPPVGTLSRVGYRQLLEAGIRIFEYGGPMMHAKTTVVDGRFSRVGSTNLNIASLVTNWEIDLLAEDADFGARMERMFEEDLDDAREVILESRGPGRNPRPRPASPATKPEQRRPREAAPRALATATRLGRTAFEMTSREGLRRHERLVVAAVAGAALAALEVFSPSMRLWSLLSLRMRRTSLLASAAASALEFALSLPTPLPPMTRLKLAAEISRYLASVVSSEGGGHQIPFGNSWLAREGSPHEVSSGRCPASLPVWPKPAEARAPPHYRVSAESGRG